MVTIARFYNNEDAHLFRSFLASEGIEAHIPNEVVSQVLPHHSFATGGTRLAVAEEDAERAEALYRGYRERVSDASPEVGDRES